VMSCPMASDKHSGSNFAPKKGPIRTANPRLHSV
jgi:hypothetical protein